LRFTLTTLLGNRSYAEVWDPYRNLKLGVCHSLNHSVENNIAGQEAGDPLTGGGQEIGLGELLVKDVWVNGVEG
ncbi:hypothetical protein ILYODFUR_028580, partial [Ilyodon furcidens]